jgi:alkylation response protein AidB-like acyl-CoA dehydrogenase
MLNREGRGEEAADAAVERMQDRLYHDLLTPPDAVQARLNARTFADREVAPRAWAIAHTEESPEAFAWDVFAGMASADLFGIPFEASIGGLGLSHRATATAVAVEELAYHSNSIAAVYDVHCILAGHALECGSAALQERWLRPLIEGRTVGCFATTEPEASSDLSVAAMETAATFDGDWITISGRKRWITNSPVASFVCLLCRDGERMTLVLVPLDTEGVHVGAPDRKLGNHGQLTADIRFDGVTVPAGNVIGKRGDGLKLALQTLTYGRIGIAATGVGMAQAVFDQVVHRMKRRRVFGKALAEMQYWQFRLAERATEIENARNLYLKAALRLDAGVGFPEPEAAMAKWYATNLAGEFARDGVQIFGGYGFMRELAADSSRYRVEEIYRDAKIAEIYEGANEIQKWIIARSIFGKDFTG